VVGGAIRDRGGEGHAGESEESGGNECGMHFWLYVVVVDVYVW